MREGGKGRKKRWGGEGEGEGDGEREREWERDREIEGEKVMKRPVYLYQGTPVNQQQKAADKLV